MTFIRIGKKIKRVKLDDGKTVEITFKGNEIIVDSDYYNDNLCYRQEANKILRTFKLNRDGLQDRT